MELVPFLMRYAVDEITVVLGYQLFGWLIGYGFQSLLSFSYDP